MSFLTNDDLLYTEYKNMNVNNKNRVKTELKNSCGIIAKLIAERFK
jgi:hypothetical protein